MEIHRLPVFDNARISKIARAVSESIAFADLKLPAALIFKHLILDDLDVAFLGLI
jgi:hypothetical protein